LWRLRLEPLRSMVGSGSMLNLGAGARRVYLAVGETDLREGFDGLYGLVASRLEEVP
jgi:hypothetical protein